MEEIDKKIQHAKNEKQRLNNCRNELITQMKIKESEISLMDTFIDELNHLKSKMNNNL